MQVYRLQQHLMYSQQTATSHTVVLHGRFFWEPRRSSHRPDLIGLGLTSARFGLILSDSVDPPAVLTRLMLVLRLVSGSLGMLPRLILSIGRIVNLGRVIRGESTWMDSSVSRHPFPSALRSAMTAAPGMYATPKHSRIGGGEPDGSWSASAFFTKGGQPISPGGLSLILRKASTLWSFQVSKLHGTRLGQRARVPHCGNLLMRAHANRPTRNCSRMLSRRQAAQPNIR